MLYNRINSGKFRIRRVVLIYFLIISYLTTFSSCMTTEISNVSPNSIDSASIGDISKIELKDGTVMDCEGKIIKIKKGSDSTVFFDISTYTVGDSYKTYWSNKRIAAGDIWKIQLERTVKNESKSNTTVILVVAGVLLIGILVSISFMKF